MTIPRPAPPLRDAPWFDTDGYPFEARYLEVPTGPDGEPARLHYLDEGSGPPLVIVGGTPGWSYEWRGVVRRLRDHFRVIVPDHLGMGPSDRHGDPAFPLSAHRRNLTALLAELGVERSHWIVHDFGGPIALPTLVKETDRVDRLVIMNSWMWDFGSVQPSFERQRRFLGGRIMSWLYRNTNLSPGVLMRKARGKGFPRTKAESRHFTRPFPNRHHRDQLHAFLRSLLEDGPALEVSWRSGAPLRDTPTLLLWGMEDPLVIPEHLARWRTDLPDARVERLEGVGHFPHDEVPDRVGAIVEDFLGVGSGEAR